MDVTPFDDSEFKRTDSGLLAVDASGAAAGRLDLLTVVMHELGHLLGRGDVDVEVDARDLMNATLPGGVRRLPDGPASAAPLGGAVETVAVVRPRASGDGAPALPRVGDAAFAAFAPVGSSAGGAFPTDSARTPSSAGEGERAQLTRVLLALAAAAPFDPARAGVKAPPADDGRLLRTSLVDATFAAFPDETPLAGGVAALSHVPHDGVALSLASDVELLDDLARLWEDDLPPARKS